MVYKCLRSLILLLQKTVLSNDTDSVVHYDYDVQIPGVQLLETESLYSLVDLPRINNPLNKQLFSPVLTRTEYLLTIKHIKF